VVIGMEDYPKTLLEFERRFATDEACRLYLEQLRWPEGFVCPACAATKAWPMERGLWLCSHCRKQVSVKAGTIFQDSRLPLRLWFRAMWYVTSQKNGSSAKNIQRVLGLGSYQTAWAWLHKLRRAMVRPGRDPLHGKVEVDETYIGGREKGKLGREQGEKALVAIAVELRGARLGRIRLQRIPDASAPSLLGFLHQSVAEGAEVHTDGWRGYGPITTAGYLHRTHKQTTLASPDPCYEQMPHTHQVASLLKRWLLGTHQGAVRAEHLDYYLDEFTFRFNRRKAASPGKLFYRLVEQAVQIEPCPYRTLLRPNL
jgi:transposase-like protein